MSHYDRAVHAVIQCQQSFRSPLAPGRQMFGFLWFYPFVTNIGIRLPVLTARFSTWSMIRPAALAWK